MSTVEFIELGGYLLSAWSSGFIVGALQGFFRRLSEQI